MSMALDLQRLSNNQIWRGLRQRNVSRDNHPLNVCHKLQFSCEIAHYRKNSISVFQEIFASADKVLFFERRTEHEAIILWSFKIFLIFRNYIRFQASPSAKMPWGYLSVKVLSNKVKRIIYNICKSMPVYVLSINLLNGLSMF